MTLDSTELLKVLDPDSPRISEEESKVNSLRYDDALDVPIQLTDADMWDNYCNDELYWMDKKIREWIRGIEWRKVTKATNGQKVYRTTVSMVFAWIYGRSPKPGADGPACRMIHRLLVYYCKTYTGKTTLHGKEVGRVYKFTPHQSRISGKRGRRAFSLRLRLEEAQKVAEETGEPINYDALFRANPTLDKIDGHRRADSQAGADEDGKCSRNQRRYAAIDRVSPKRRNKRGKVSGEQAVH